VRLIRLNGSDFDIGAIVALVFVAMLAIGAIWVIYDAFGSALPLSIWLVVVSVIGILSIGLFFSLQSRQ